ncbi:MAG: aspartate carbamoyltransferase [Oscillospiraceae bacterium]|nr:aspartate carbamoyltransferase [Oscillospiraceae bacterium]
MEDTRPFGHLIDLDAFPAGMVTGLLATARTIMSKPEYYCDSCHGKILATLFYEPSTRTQMSFQAAILRLGGKVIGFDNPGNSSVSKGESLKDTVRVISNYADILTIRHPQEGAAKAASLFSCCCVINAGDGGHLHPTQTLTDLFTLSETKGRIDHLTVGLCGDLLNGRTVHSLAKTLCRFPGNRFVLISTPELTLPPYVLSVLRDSGCAFTMSTSLLDSIGDLDVLYMTRIQRERFGAEEEYKRQKGVFVLDAEKMRHAKAELRVLHPLPRVDEIDYEVDYDPRAVYFDQTAYGMYVRQALILHMLDGAKKATPPRLTPEGAGLCPNPRCITRVEPYLPPLFTFGTGYVCGYCDHEV